MHLIIVSADQDLTASLAEEAARAGHVVAIHRRSADLTVEQLGPRDAVAVVDWLLPDEPGTELCRRLRTHERHRSLPVVLLVGSCDEADKRLAVGAGADVILLKPVSVKEVMARLAALASGRPDAAPFGRLQVAGIELDLAAQIARHRGRPVHLGAVDGRLLEFLLTSQGRPCTRPEIVAAVWGQDIPSERTIDVYIARLRRALRTAWNADPIRTVRGVGYALDAADFPRPRTRRRVAAAPLNRAGHRQSTG